MNREILHGDVLDKLATISDETIDVIISSPPFWSLRDYSVEGQIGLEPDFHDYLNTMQKVMDGLKRVLKPTGTCWINLGDTYSTVSGGMRDMAKGKPNHHGKINYDANKGFQSALKIDQSKYFTGLKSKSLVGIPQRFMINCIDNGWICRNDIVWSKVNAMPSSVKDRFSNKHERIFFFSKNKRYYFDLDAVRVPSKTASKPFNVRVRDSDTNRFLQGATDSEKQNHNGKGEYNGKASKEYLQKWIKNEDSIHGTNANNPKGKNPGDVFYDKSKPYAVVEREGIIYYRDLPEHDKIREFLNDARKKAKFTIDDLEELYGNFTPHHWFERDGSYPTIEDWQKIKKILQFDDRFDDQMLIEYPKDAAKIDNPKGKNPGDIFQINPKPYREAHFATFPVDLPLKILKCACPNQVCNKCGKPREVLKKSIKNNDRLSHTEQAEINKKRGMVDQTQRTRWVGGDIPYTKYEIIGYTDCGCNAGFKPGIVLDPFFGAGTVGLAAEKLGLNWIGIELNAEYIKIAQNRLSKYMNNRIEAFV